MAKEEPRPWEKTDLPRGCLAWVKAVDRIMLEEFGIALSDAGADRADVLRYWKFDESPTDFVDWFANKYDLIPTNDSGYLPRRLGVTVSRSGHRAER